MPIQWPHKLNFCHKIIEKKWFLSPLRLFFFFFLVSFLINIQKEGRNSIRVLCLEFRAVGKGRWVLKHSSCSGCSGCSCRRACAVRITRLAFWHFRRHPVEYARRPQRRRPSWIPKFDKHISFMSQFIGSAGFINDRVQGLFWRILISTTDWFHPDCIRSNRALCVETEGSEEVLTRDSTKRH